MGYINEKKLTKHICQLESVPTGPEQGKIPCHFSEHTGKGYAS